MDAPLPYDSTPPPSPPPPHHTTLPAQDPLDRPLDDYTPAVPEHVKSLMGRMSKGKVYLLEESPGVLHVDGGERIKGDPRIAQLAQQLDSQDPTSWLEAVSAGQASSIRTNALLIRSDLIKHLSTSKVFAWTTSLGASPMGIEWLNDTTLILIFPTAASALLALTLLAKAGFDPSEGDDPLLPRSAHSFPISLLPIREPDPVPSQAGTELLSSGPAGDGDAEGVRRKGRGTFGGSGAFDLPALARADDGGDSKIVLGVELAEGVDPNARVEVRFATADDGGLRKGAKESGWYKRHGRGAGKEVATSGRRSLGRDAGRDEGVSFSGRGIGAEGDGGGELGRRIGRERRRMDGPYERRDGARGQGRGGGRKTEEDLDKELERIARARLNGEEVVEGDVEMGDAEVGERRYGGGRRGGRREPRGREDLDKELDDMFAARTTGES